MASTEKTVMGSNGDGKRLGRKRKAEVVGDGEGKVKKPKKDKFYDRIRSGNTKVKELSFNKRKPTLRNKARELQNLCGINVCLILVNPDGTIDKKIMWPEKESDARNIIEEYMRTEAKYKVEEQLVNFFKTKLRKLEKKKVAYFVDSVSKRLEGLGGEELSKVVDDILEPMLKKFKNRAEFLNQNQENEADCRNYNDNNNNLDLAGTSEFSCDDLNTLLELDLPESYELPPIATLSPQNPKSSPEDCKLSPQYRSFSPQDGDFSTQYHRLSPQGSSFSPQDRRLSPQGCNLVRTREFNCDNLNNLLELEFPEPYELQPIATLSPQNCKSSTKECENSSQDYSFSLQNGKFFPTQDNRLYPQG